jgi:hypothetical protein
LPLKCAVSTMQASVYAEFVSCRHHTVHGWMHCSKAAPLAPGAARKRTFWVISTATTGIRAAAHAQHLEQCAFATMLCCMLAPARCVLLGCVHYKYAPLSLQQHMPSAAPNACYRAAPLTPGVCWSSPLWSAPSSINKSQSCCTFVSPFRMRICYSVMLYASTYQVCVAGFVSL